VAYMPKLAWKLSSLQLDATLGFGRVCNCVKPVKRKSTICLYSLLRYLDAPHVRSWCVVLSVTGYLCLTFTK